MKHRIKLMESVDEELCKVAGRSVAFQGYSMGDCPTVKMELFVENRRRLAEHISGICRLSIIFVEGNNKQDPTLYWLFGVREAGYCGAIDVLECKAYLFYPLHCCHDKDTLRDSFMVDYVDSSDKIVPKLSSLRRAKVLILGDCFVSLWNKFNVDGEILRIAASRLRAVKSTHEVEVISHLSRVTCDAVEYLFSAVRGDVYLFQVEAMLESYLIRMGGCQLIHEMSRFRTSNSLRLQCHRYSQNVRTLEGELCIAEVASSYFGYYTTVSTTFPIGQKLDNDQETLCNIVLKVFKGVCSGIGEDVTINQLNETAGRLLLTYMKQDLDVLEGVVEEMLAVHLDEVFTSEPCCAFVGLLSADVTDCSRRLESGMVVSVGSGCYFRESAIDAARSKPHTGQFLRESINGYQYLGGASIRNVVVVTPKGCQLLAALVAPQIGIPSEHISLFIEQTRTSKVQVTAWGVFKIDTSLNGSFVNTLLTFFIAMAQFANEISSLLERYHIE